MRALRPLIAALGIAGLLGLVLLALCAAFYVGSVRPAESALKAQQEAARRLKTRTTPVQPVSVDNRSDELRRFYGLFPVTDQIAQQTERLWSIANDYKIDLQQGEYRLETNGPGLVRYRVTLPIRASYSQIRQFISFVLKEIPVASIDSLRFERKKISDTQLEAQIKLTLYFRSAAEAAAQP